MKAGDTFIIPQPGTRLDSHLWVVLSDPSLDEEKILIVSFTTLREDSDKACILAAGDHPFVKHATCVSYSLAKVVSKASIEVLLTKGLMRSDAHVSPALLQRMREGAANSEQMKLDYADILINQGLIEC